MPFTATQFIKARPYLFHLTDRNNIDQIRNDRLLYSAMSLMQQANDTSFLRQKRNTSVNVQVESATISIRDQQPLHKGNMRIQDGWDFEDVLQSLNERVFFWPGTATGPISYGKRHFERYVDESPAILRISTAESFNANSNIDALYCRYNSGSPRCSNGLGSPRGPNTFVSSADADYTPSKVVEVTFLDQVVLPAMVEVGDSATGPWQSL